MDAWVKVPELFTTGDVESTEQTAGVDVVTVTGRSTLDFPPLRVELKNALDAMSGNGPAPTRVESALVMRNCTGIIVHWKLRETLGAGAQRESPACDAWIVHVTPEPVTPCAGCTVFWPAA